MIDDRGVVFFCLFVNIRLSSGLITLSFFRAIPDYTKHSYSFLSVTEKKLNMVLSFIWKTLSGRLSADHLLRREAGKCS
jgi:hypothetical protein